MDPHLSISYLGQIYSPFSGKAADGEDGPNESDATLLFVYYGDASIYGYISERLRAALGTEGTEALERIEPSEFAERSKVKDMLLLRVDTDWNGINWYCFAPVSD